MIPHARSSPSHTPFPRSTCYCTFLDPKSAEIALRVRARVFPCAKVTLFTIGQVSTLFLLSLSTTVKGRITRFKFLGGCGNISGTSSLPLTSLCSALITNGINNLNKPQRCSSFNSKLVQIFHFPSCFQLNLRVDDRSEKLSVIASTRNMQTVIVIHQLSAKLLLFTPKKRKRMTTSDRVSSFSPTIFFWFLAGPFFILFYFSLPSLCNVETTDTKHTDSRRQQETLFFIDFFPLGVCCRWKKPDKFRKIEQTRLANTFKCLLEMYGPIQSGSCRLSPFARD